MWRAGTGCKSALDTSKRMCGDDGTTYADAACAGGCTACRIVPGCPGFGAARRVGLYLTLDLV